MDKHEWREIYYLLSVPFEAKDVSFRVGSQTRDKKRGQALPYAEPRVYEDRLNAIVGHDWSCSFKPWGENRIIAEVTIHGITRSSTGEENDGFAPGTAAEAQAFKRACSKFGLGRYLYDVPITWVDVEDGKLKESPTLSHKWLPKQEDLARINNYSNGQDKVIQDNVHAGATKAGDESNTPLSQDRAKAMYEELKKLGYDTKQQLQLSEFITGRVIKKLTELTEAEALSVWSKAKADKAPVSNAN